MQPSIGPMQPTVGFMPPPTIGGDFAGVSDKLVHIEDDINEVNEIMGTVNKLNDKFKVLEEEWWHYTLKDQPYPDTFFNFPESINENNPDTIT